MRRLTFPPLFLLPLAFLTGAALAAPPANDNFANALVIPSVPASISANNVDATLEPGEPNSYIGGGTGGRSVWWQWTAPTSGEVTMQITRSSPTYYPRFGVFTGPAVGSLTSVASHWDYYSVAFQVVAGTTYHIAIDGGSVSTGSSTPVSYTHLTLPTKRIV